MMTKYPYFVYQLEQGLCLKKTIHFIPVDEEAPKGGMTIFCRVSPFDENGMIESEARRLIQKLAFKERMRTGRPVCAVFGPEDCDYIGPQGEVYTSDDPPRLRARLTDVSPDEDEQLLPELPNGGPIDLTTALKKQKAIIH